MPRLLRWLLRLYPESFRNRLGADLLETCEARRRAAGASGVRARAGFWLGDVPRLALDGLIERAAGAQGRQQRGRPLRALDVAIVELRSAVRGLRRSRGFAALAAATLGLGLGAATAVFSVADAVLFRGLPWPAPEELYLVEARYGDAFEFGSHSAPNLRDLQERATLLGGLVGARDASPAIGGAADPRRVGGQLVTPGYFELLGAAPARGRGLLPDDYAPGAPRVAVISHAVWQGRFGGRPDVIGQPLVVDGVAHEIVGVLPASWRDPDELLGQTAPALWLPLRRDDPGWDDRSSWNLRVLARLPAQVPRPRADAQLAAIGAGLAEAYPDHNTLAGHGLEPVLRPLDERIREDARPRVLLLLGAIGLLLVASCTDVANLFLTRSAHRAGELTIRRALGASRRRVLGQLVAEAVVVCGAATALGVVAAVAGVRAVRAFGPELPRLTEAVVDARAIAVAGAVALLAAVTFGVVGLAAQHGRSALRVGERVTDSKRTRRLRGALVVAQLAFAFTLLAGAGLLLNSFARLLRVDPGFEPEAVVALEVRVGDELEADGKAATFHARLLERARGLPGVARAALMQDVPSIPGGMYTRFEAEGHPETWDPTRFVRQNAVSADAFAVLGVSVLEGRAFRPDDGRTGEPVAVVNESAARTLWGDESPVGRRLRQGGEKPGPWMTVVGVAAAVHQRSAGREPDPEVFVPWAGEATGRVRLVAKAAGDPAPLFPALRALVAELDPALPVDRLVPLEEAVAATLAEPRFDAALLLAFSALTLLLAAVGLYGSVAYAVSQETRPLAVRRALGATPQRLAARVLGRGAALAGLGLVLGLAGSVAAGRLLESMLFGVTPADPPTLAAAAVLLAAVSLLACAAPARRAARVEPAVILRGE